MQGWLNHQCRRLNGNFVNTVKTTCHLERTGSIWIFTTTKKGVNGADRNLQVKKAVTILLQRMIGMKMLQRVILTRHQWSRIVVMNPEYLNQVFVIVIFVRILVVTFFGSKLKTTSWYMVQPGFHKFTALLAQSYS